MSKILSLKNATIKFGGLTAVNDVSFDINEGELFGLIGPNGAGKTTCFNLVTGVYTPTSGDVLFNNERINGLPPFKIARKGIARTFQNIRLFGALSAIENVMIAGSSRQKSGAVSALFRNDASVAETKKLKEEGMYFLEVMNLANEANSRSCDLPYGKQRRLEIARALATKPDLLLLDEPAAGMNPQESDDLGQRVRMLRDELGKTVLLIEHDMKFVMNLCERIVVLDRGIQIAHGVPAEIRSHPEVIKAYLGEAV